MPAWLDATLALVVVALALWWVVRKVRQPACAACPSAKQQASAAAHRVALGATRLGRRGNA